MSAPLPPTPGPVRADVAASADDNADAAPGGWPRLYALTIGSLALWIALLVWLGEAWR